MPSDPFYQSPEWRALRKACLDRDSNRCTTCQRRGWIAHHVRARKQGGPDSLANLTTLCATCDNRTHADKAGTPRKVAVGADGWPLAPSPATAAARGPAGGGGRVKSLGLGGANRQGRSTCSAAK